MEIISRPDVDAEKSYFSEKTGVHAIVMKGHSENPKLPDAEAEFEAARAAADNGIGVVLTPEGAGYEMYATLAKVMDNGAIKHKFSDGKMAAFTFEQRTPVSIEKSAYTTVRAAIRHANEKHAEIALIYDKHSLFHREDIENGMKLYQQGKNTWRGKGVKFVVVISSSKKLYEHHFDN